MRSYFIIALAFIVSSAHAAEPTGAALAPPINESATAQELELIEKNATQSDRAKPDEPINDSTIDSQIDPALTEKLLDIEDTGATIEENISDDSAIQTIGEGEDIGIELNMSEDITFDSVEIRPVLGPGLANEKGLNAQELLENTDTDISAPASEEKTEPPADIQETSADKEGNTEARENTEEELQETGDAGTEAEDDMSEDGPPYERWWGRPY
jgi:hypothetical protein